MQEPTVRQFMSRLSRTAMLAFLDVFGFVLPEHSRKLPFLSRSTKGIGFVSNSLAGRQEGRASLASRRKVAQRSSRWRRCPAMARASAHFPPERRFIGAVRGQTVPQCIALLVTFRQGLLVRDCVLHCAGWTKPCASHCASPARLADGSITVERHELGHSLPTHMPDAPGRMRTRSQGAWLGLACRRAQGLQQ